MSSDSTHQILSENQEKELKSKLDEFIEPDNNNIISNELKEYIFSSISVIYCLFYYKLIRRVKQ